MLHRIRGLSNRIATIDDLRDHLQVAIELEHSTIPPYLCAFYSIPEGTNPEARRVLGGIVTEEMFHMGLASNVLLAIGGQPCMNHTDFLPTYPAPLPHSDGAFEVHLGKFSPATVHTFMRIEHPAAPHAHAQADRYHTIGQFYEAIEEGLRRVCKGNQHFVSDSPQVTDKHFRPDRGTMVEVTDLDSALYALELIIAQGEGLHHSVSDGMHEIFGEGEEVAHYFRLHELAAGRTYLPNDTPRGGPKGPPLAVDWDVIYPMAPNPHAAEHPIGSAERTAIDEFNRIYRGMLEDLHLTFNGEPERLNGAIDTMFVLKDKAVALMQMPTGKPGATLGPTFEWINLA